MSTMNLERSSNFIREIFKSECKMFNSIYKNPHDEFLELVNELNNIKQELNDVKQQLNYVKNEQSVNGEKIEDLKELVQVERKISSDLRSELNEVKTALDHSNKQVDFYMNAYNTLKNNAEVQKFKSFVHDEFEISF